MKNQIFINIKKKIIYQYKSNFYIQYKIPIDLKKNEFK